MPRVETYQADQVQTQVVKGPRANIQSAPLEPIARGLSSLAGSLEQERNRLDQAAAEEAVVNFERQKNDLFFNSESGYFNTQGRNAFDQAGPMNKSIEELKRIHGDTLKSPGARQSFDRVANQHITRSQQDIARHSSKHLKAWEIATINSQVENTLENASLYWSDSQRLGVQRELGRQSIIDASDLAGVGPEVTQERLQNYDSSFARSVVDAAIVSSSTEAKEALDKWEKNIEGPDLLKIKTSIQRKEKAEKTAQDSRAAVLQAGNLVTTLGDQDNARSLIIEQINKIEDPDQRSRTMKESMFQLSNKQKADSESRAATFENAENHIINGGSVEVFKTENPDEWERLTARQKRTLSSGKTVVTDYNTYYDLINQPVEDLAKTNTTDHFDKLDPAYRQKLQSAVNSAKKGLRDGQTSRDTLRKQRLQELTGVIRPSSTHEIKVHNTLNRTLDSMITSKQESLGKDFLSDVEYAEVMDNFSKTLVKSRDFWFDTEQNIADIDSENLDAYSKYLRNNGINITTDTLLLVENNKEHKAAALKGR